MDNFSNGPGGAFTPDDFDLLTLGLIPGDPFQEEAQAPEEEPRINPLHDMDSLEFLLWVEEEAEKTVARRKAQQAAQGKDKP